MAQESLYHQEAKATVLRFPVQTACQSCGRPCGEDELSACYTCGETFCGSAKTNCKSICACDRMAADFALRVDIMKPGLLTRLWRVVSFAVCVVVVSLVTFTPAAAAVVSQAHTVGDDSAAGFIMLLVLTVLSLLAYFIPSFVANGRNRAQAIFMLNLLLGWTVLGWVGALIWAMCEKPVQIAKAA